jgi:3-phenylpropionate/trans-cinnamate dioxygenase ferredoxin reductase subunit
MIRNVVMIGAGQAAAQAVDTLRRRGFGGPITVIGDESESPYQRPPLSKKYLAGALQRERLLIRPTQFYADHRIDLRLGRRALEIDRRSREIRLDDGERLAYDALLLATGSRPRRPTIPGASLEGVHFLRTLADVDRLRGELAPGRRIAIVGGGYIGLEVAATCRELGLEVTVLEMAARLMSRVVCEPISAFFESAHARHGVRTVCNARVQALTESAGRVSGVQCEDGTEYPAEVVLIGVGVLAAEELAAAAGIECANGIVVDEHCRTSDPHVYAAGDCTNHPSPHYGVRVRLESVDNAFEQGSSAALNLLGVTTVHDKVPWFWSDQYDLKLQIAGLARAGDELVTRGDPDTRKFAVFHLRNNRVAAVEAVNAAPEYIVGRKLIAEGATVAPARLADTSIPMKNIASV